jgi:chitinase
VLTNGDTKYESNETFLVNLSDPTNATIARRIGTGTIRNDDRKPTVTISDVTVDESASGSSFAVFTLALSPPSGLPVTVSYATADGTAKAGYDYTSTSGTLVFDPGQLSQTISVEILSDSLQEATETFYVKLSSPKQATLGRSKAKGTIEDQALEGLFAAEMYVEKSGKKSRPAEPTVAAFPYLRDKRVFPGIITSRLHFQPAR